MRMLAVGGGSGGHVTPVLAVIKSLHKKDSSLEVCFVTDVAFGEQATRLMQQAPVPVDVRVIPAGKLRRYKQVSLWKHLTLPHIVWPNIRDGFRIISGIFASVWLLLRWKPDVVFAKGGYVSLPVGIAAHWLRIPLVIHDSDARAGLTNKVLSSYAVAIGTGTPVQNYRYDVKKTTYVGVPVDERFAPIDTKTMCRYKQELGFDATKPLVVAVGGGLGAQSINEACVNTLQKLTKRGIQLYIVTGKQHINTVASGIDKTITGVTAVPFVYNAMDHVLGAADLVVSRASATFMQELAALKKPVIAVPSKHLGDQIKNAEAFDAAGAVILASDDTIEEVMNEIPALLGDKHKLERLAHNLHSFYKPHAADDMAKIIYTSRKTQ